MDLQPLFAAPILAQTYLDPGYSGHTNDVWLVRTAVEEAVVRVVRMRGDPEHPCWWGCGQLFGRDPRRVHDQEALNALITRLSPIPAPRVLRKGWVDGRQYVVVERMPGTPLASFERQPAALLVMLGRALARLHAERFSWCGCLTGRLRYPPAEFHPRAAALLAAVVPRFYAADPAFARALPAMVGALTALPPPAAGALVMPDLDPTQFLALDGRLTAVVDTEAYGIGPRELDFVALEYLLDAPGAAAFARGYAAVLPLPDLAAVRLPYRFLYRVLDVPGDVPLAAWLAHPARFA